MKPIYLLPLLLLFAMPACKKQESRIEKNYNGLRLASHRAVTASSSTTSTYEYNEKGFLVKYTTRDSVFSGNKPPTEYISVTTYERDVKNAVIKSVTNNSSGLSERTYTYTDGVLQTVASKYESYKIHYEHEHGKIVRVVFREESGYLLYKYLVKYNGNGDVERIDVVGYGNDTTDSKPLYTNITYDDKPNIMGTVTGSGGLTALRGLRPEGLSVHNATGYTYYPTIGNIATNNFEFSYNSDGYVERSTSANSSQINYYKYERY